ncbi:ABC transporter substrate-binding protein [Varunaivibrio sulfuroxidans]|uniref:Iron(III) transport system substrate-binding protein n=1 Tax=Varunaivibrio sulfuroxidans TaxID=1773489 RepID=A0A4R3JDR1_9PROT|nr:ABC transporter substrate-binding protein [Varunaivibrio sulfuroxidans]TCS64168.1 iron(III) transport system substrate-binding protein [Varunaivibrio sulfuroxidans]WES31386.1 ABC transporter substrate-binding protein [Varunaivibrio sulfuroxidans]
MHKTFTAMALAMLASSLVSAPVPAFAADPLVVYSAGPKPLSGALVKAFEKKTGLQVSLFQSSSGKVMARYQAEKANPHADVLISASWGHAITLDKAGELLPYTSPGAAHVPADLKTPTYVAEGAAALAIAYNTKSGLPAPAHWSDLTRPAYKGQVTMPDPAKSGSALTLVEGLVNKDGAQAWSMFKGLHDNGMIVPGANKAALTPVLQGAKGVVFGAVDYIAIGSKMKGEAIDIVYPSEGTVLAPRPIMILKSTRHPAAAKAFVDFVLSKEGQRLVAARYILPARTDVVAKRAGWDALHLIKMDYVAAADHAAATKDHFAKVMRGE